MTFFSLRIPPPSLLHPPRPPAQWHTKKQAFLQIAPSAVKWLRTFLHWIPIKRLQLYNIRVGLAIFSADLAC